MWDKKKAVFLRIFMSWLKVADSAVQLAKKQVKLKNYDKHEN